MKKPAWLGVVVALACLVVVPTGAGAQQERDRPRPVKHPRLATSLLEEAGLAPQSPQESAPPTRWTDRQGRVLVAIDGEGAQVRAAVEAVGGAVSNDGTRTIEAYVPANRLRALADAPGVTSVREPSFAEPHVESEGVVETETSAWHTAGETGAGVTVAIVDVGFAGLDDAVAAEELPAGLPSQDFCENGLPGGPPGSPGITHGTAVAEIVHDMAPAASLHLVCVDTDQDLIDAAVSLPTEVDVVNASIGNPLFGRGDGSGEVGNAVRQSRLAGKLWTVSAGNSGDRHFNFTGTTVDPDFGSVFQRPNDIFYSVTVGGGGLLDVKVKWDAWPGTNLDFNFCVYANQADYPFNPLLCSGFLQDGTQPPVEGLAFQSPFPTNHTFYVEIFAFEPNDNPAGRRFDIFVDGDLIGVESVTGSSVSEPATSPYVMTVGAHNWNGGALEPFSSRGPTIDGRVKPDISGPDAVQNFTLNPFFGTSAAAPHTAGAAAVFLGANPELDVAELQGILESRSLDSGSQGLDNLFGFGRLRLGAVGVPEPPAGDLFVAVNPPVRVADTRLCNPRCVLSGGQELDLAVAGQTFGSVTIPVDATAIAFNVTAVAPTAPGFITVYPNGQARPTVSHLSNAPGRSRANHVTAGVGTGGRIRFYNSAGNTNLVVDLAGYYAPSGTVGLIPLNPPVRAMDTRQPGGGGKFGPGETRTLPLGGQTIGGTTIPATAQAVALNVTVVAPTANGFLTVWPGGSPRPVVSSISFATGQAVPNLVIATLGGAPGAIQLFNSAGTTHVVVDVLGYFDTPANDPTAGRYVSINPPRRNLDTRTGNGPRHTPLGPAETFPHQTRLLYRVPVPATAALMNITVVTPAGGGFLTVFPDGVPRPVASNLSFVAGQVVPNAVISSIGSSGRISIYNGSGGTTPTVVDLAGFFVPTG